MDGAKVIVGEIDRDLGHSIVLDVPADRLDVPEAAGEVNGLALGIPDDVSLGIPLRPSALPKAERDLVGEPAIAGVQVDVVGDKAFTGSYERRPRPWIEGGRTAMAPPS